MDNKLEISSLGKLLLDHSKGQAAAFEQFYKIMFNELRVYGAHFESPEHNLEDYIQSFLLNVYSSPEPFLNKDHTLAYILKCFRNFIFKEQEKESAKDVKVELDQIVENNYYKIQAAGEKKSLVQFCNSMLSELGPKERELIYLKYYKGMKSVEIAKILGMNRQVVRNLIYRATQKLRKSHEHNEQIRSSFEMIFNGIVILIWFFI
ncbi:RNA polymerase sigma factor [Portibacter lacus]|uniref:DNA-directed RNA polymerase sigma-70 factor n=1 Tax=Portibacter lacus TaxID=1099794 RepID=A0AA37SSN2_9BACT|nr:sigma-70 family RNA polymerase sigma factor [Portibacter lacus]GLR19312.1 DNA-directed RNA polymerase sigma-70 factor [Portibacter lacus]